jgi:putative membrane protein
MLVAAGFAVLAQAGTARAVNPDAPPSTEAVLTKLHMSNQMEIAAGKLAEQKGQSKDVKSFGKTLVTDHTAADKKVMALAKDEKVSLPTDMPMPDAKMDKLKTASGAEFDKMFASEMLEDHKKDIAEAKLAQGQTQDPKLRGLLSALIPTLEKHKDTAQKLVDKLGPSASAAGSNPGTANTTK